MPWVGLAALVAMFVLPLVPDWLWEWRPEGRRRAGRPEVPEAPEWHVTPGQVRPVRGELRRLDGRRELEGRGRGRSS